MQSLQRNLYKRLGSKALKDLFENIPLGVKGLVVPKDL